jgi:HemY protein
VLAARMKQMACETLLQERRHDADALNDLWRELTTEERRSPRIASQAALYFSQLSRPDDAKRIVEEGLKAHWDGRLIRRYADCAVAGRALPLIQQAEKWLAQHPVDADLFYTLGMLCFKEQLWGKAQASLESALKYADAEHHGSLRAQAHLALAQLYEQTERMEGAQRHYRQSALLAVK